MRRVPALGGSAADLRRGGAAGWLWPALAVVAALPVAWAAQRGLGLPAQRPAAVAAWGWVLVAAPVVEEWVLRRWLQQGLEDRLSAGRASALATLAFALLHAPAHGWLAFWWLAPGLALAETWRRQRSVGACILLHAWFNASWMLAIEH